MRRPRADFATAPVTPGAVIMGPEAPRAGETTRAGRFQAGLR
jgi:hypothetical protein